MMGRSVEGAIAGGEVCFLLSGLMEDAGFLQCNGVGDGGEEGGGEGEGEGERKKERKGGGRVQRWYLVNWLGS